MVVEVTVLIVDDGGMEETWGELETAGGETATTTFQPETNQRTGPLHVPEDH